jgi:hypothetical protein
MIARARPERQRLQTPRNSPARRAVPSTIVSSIVWNFMRAGTKPNPPREGSRLAELRATLLVAAIAMALACVPELVRSGFYFHDDMQLQYVPLLRAIGEAVADLRLPLLTNETYYGGAIAGEYQHGALSVFHAALCFFLCALKLEPAGLALGVSLAYVGFTAAGAFRLARRFVLAVPLAAAVAWIAALNGFGISWSSWLPSLTGFAWVPWFWWALDRTLKASRSGQGQLSLGVATYGVLAAGWHFAVLMVALIGIYAVCFDRGGRSVASTAKVVLPALLVGTLLATPALACLVEYTRASVRTDYDRSSSTWIVPFSALIGLVMPRSLSTWSLFGSLEPYPNVAMANGVLPTLILPGLLLLLPRAERRRLAPCLVFALLVLVVSMLPSFSRARWSFRWLPLFHLLFGLVAARALASAVDLRAAHTGRLRRILLSPLVWSSIIVCLTLTFHAADLSLAFSGLVVVATAALYEVALRRDAAPLAFAAGIVANLVASPLSGPARDATPHWDFDACAERLGSVGRGRRHVGVYGEGNVINVRERPFGPARGQRPCLLPGNAGLLFSRPFVNGYSPVFPSGLSEILGVSVHGNLQRADALRLLGSWQEPGALLDRWGVEFMTVPDLEEFLPNLERSGWRRLSDLGGAWLFGRPRSVPPPLLESIVPGVTAASVLETRDRLIENRGQAWVYTQAAGKGAYATYAPLTRLVPTRVSETAVEAEVKTGPERASLVLLRRAHFAGYRATLDAEPLRVGRADGVFVAVEIPAERSGLLVVEYRPLGVRSAALSCFALGVLGLGALGMRGFRRPTNGPRRSA